MPSKNLDHLSSNGTGIVDHLDALSPDNSLNRQLYVPAKHSSGWELIDVGEAKPDTKECPYCYEKINAQATACSHCGQLLGHYLHRSIDRPLRWRRVEWALESVVYWVKQWAILDILDFASRFAIIVAIIFWFADSGSRREEQVLRAWQVIFIAEQMNGGQATVQALETLNCSGFTVFCRPISLAGIELQELILLQLNLHKADLREANLSETVLHEADLSEAQLFKADLSGTYLLGANLSKANMTNTILHETYMPQTNLSGAYLLADLLGADLHGANLSGANLSGASNLHSADLRGAKYNSSRLADIK